MNTNNGLAAVRRLGSRWRRQKAQAEATRTELDQAIREARDLGHTYQEIADAAQLSPMTVHNTIKGRKYR